MIQILSLLNFPDIEYNAFEISREVRSTDKEGIVQPAVFAVSRCLKLRCCLEVERGLSVGIRSVGDNAAVAYVDIDAIVCLDAVDSLQLRTALGVGYLVVSTTVDDSAFQ